MRPVALDVLVVFAASTRAAPLPLGRDPGAAVNAGSAAGAAMDRTCLTTAVLGSWQIALLSMVASIHATGTKVDQSADGRAPADGGEQDGTRAFA